MQVPSVRKVLLHKLWNMLKHPNHWPCPWPCLQTGLQDFVFLTMLLPDNAVLYLWRRTWETFPSEPGKNHFFNLWLHIQAHKRMTLRMKFKELILFHNRSPKVSYLARMCRFLAAVMEIIANCFITCHNNHYYTNTSPCTHLHVHSWPWIPK